MNISMRGNQNSLYGGNLFADRSLKSTQQKAARQEERDNKIAFFEKQKDNLKNMHCETVDEIAKKLEMFHSYEDQIAAAKVAYNNEQMMHMMDESRERGEKIAEAVEKMEPKTPEERLEDLAEEAMGIESDGIMEELQEVVEEVLEEAEEMQDDLKDVLPEEADVQVQDAGTGVDVSQTEDIVSTVQQSQEPQSSVADAYLTQSEEYAARLYRPVDVRL
mgnify:CR=1 FL=1